MRNTYYYLEQTHFEEDISNVKACTISYLELPKNYKHFLK